MFSLFKDTFDFHDQHRFRVAGKADGRTSFHCLYGCSVHYLQSRGNDALCGDIHHGLGRLVHLIENRQQRPYRLAGRHEFHGDFGDDSHGPFRTHKDTTKIVAWRVWNLAAEPDDLSVVQNCFHTENMIGGYSIGKGMRPSGVVGDIATHGTGSLAAGIRCVQVAVLLYRFRHGDIDHTGFDNGHAILQINFQNAIETSQRENYTSLGRHRSAREPGAGAARDNGNTAALRRFNHRCHLIDVTWNNDNLRHDLEDRTVLLVDDDVFLFDKDVMIPDERAQLIDERVPAHILEWSSFSIVAGHR